jgi:hypothetical protein
MLLTANTGVPQFGILDFVQFPLECYGSYELAYSIASMIEGYFCGGKNFLQGSIQVSKRRQGVGGKPHFLDSREMDNLDDASEHTVTLGASVADDARGAVGRRQGTVNLDCIIRSLFNVLAHAGDVRLWACNGRLGYCWNWCARIDVENGYKLQRAGRRPWVKPMAFSTTRYRILFKALEIGASAVFLFLCAKAFCSHFYNDLKRLVQKRRANKLRPSAIL